MSASFNEANIIRSKGRFDGVHHKADDSVQLAVSSQATAGTGLSSEELVDLECEFTGEGFRPSLEEREAAFESDEGSELYRRCMDAQLNPDTEYARPPAGQRHSSFSTEQYDRLAALGYELPSQLPPQYSYEGENVHSVLKHSITPDRLAVLCADDSKRSNMSAWENQARFTGDLEELETVLSTPGLTVLERYRALATLGHQERHERINEALNAGLGDREFIEAEQFPIDELAALRAALPKSQKNFRSVSWYAGRGVTPEHLKKFGVNACDHFEVAELEATTIPATTLRSLYAGRREASMPQLEQLHEGGFTKGNDLRLVTNAMGVTTPIKDLIAARKYATGEQLATYKTGAPPAYELTVEDAKAIGVLIKHGFPDPDSLKPHMSALHRPANRHQDHGGETFPRLAEMVKTKITPERLGVLTRAGIPVSKVGEHIEDADPWASGAPYREHFEREEQRLFDHFLSRENRSWAFTRESY